MEEVENNGGNEYTNVLNSAQISAVDSCASENGGCRSRVVKYLGFGGASVSGFECEL